MYLKTLINFTVGLALVASQSAIANEISDTFKGKTKLNLNLYVFAADIDGDISKGPISYEVE
ncbi:MULTISPECIES: hypothetical protein [Acinetobacter]|nr:MULTISPECIES: hypothetical protein [Acinetobacter]